MRKFWAVLLLASLAFVACNKDDDDDDSNTNSYNFKDQVLQGQIEGEPWTFVAGTFEYDTFFNEDGGYEVDLYPVSDTDMCGFYNPDTDKVFFSAPLETGLYRLNLDLSGNSTSRTITLLDNESVLNVILTNGAYEIVSLDTALGTMELKIDARYDSQNFINGKCTISYCK